MGLHPGARVVVAAQDVEGVAVDLHVSANGHVAWHNELHVVVNVLVLPAVEELAWNDARVLLGGLVDADAVIAEVERDDEAAVNVLGHGSVESGREPEHVLVVVDGLEEVHLRLLGHEAVHLSEGIDLVSKSIVGRWLDCGSLCWVWVLDVAQWEIVTVLAHVPSLCELVDALDGEDSAVGVNVAGWGDLIGSQVVVTDEVLAWLVHVEAVWKLLSAEEEGEGVTAVVWMVHLANFEGVIGQVVVDGVLELITLTEEAEDLTIVVEELLLTGNLATTEGLLEELLHLAVLLWWDLDLRDGEVILWSGAAWWKFTAELGLSQKKHNTVSQFSNVQFEFKSEITGLDCNLL